ncbi:MAG: DUF1761 domain-containing protein [Melioribacteraceae bacterium]|nr:DUF1761 domain-containing protein [Melioribacteraceae bacterium]
MHSVDINYLAVVACGVLSLVTGGIWYGPIFGKAWMEEIGKTEEELKKGFTPAKTYSLAVVAHIIMALVMAYFISLTSAASVVDGIRVGLASWVGFVAVSFYVNGLFNKTSVRLFIIDSGYQLVNLLLFGIILVSW